MRHSHGGSWWHQNPEFEAFNGPILLITNCLVPLKKDNTYFGRPYTTGVVGYEGATHIPDRPAGGAKDFSAMIAKAKKCAPSTELEKGAIVVGFANHQVMALADKVVEAVKSGTVKRFVVMAGCDGRQKSREYYTQVAEALPDEPSYSRRATPRRTTQFWSVAPWFRLMPIIPVNVCPKCQTPITPKAKPWERLGIPKARYVQARPWKTAKMDRKAFEALLEHVTPEAVDSLKREADAEALVEAHRLHQGMDQSSRDI